MATKDSGKKQVFDVSHPGTSAPSATSKPVITGSGAIMKDPMVQGSSSDIGSDSDDSKSEVSKTKKGRTLQPLHEDINSEDDDTTKAESVNVAVKAGDSTSAETDDKTADSSNDETQTAVSSSDQDADEPEDTAEPKNAIVDAVIDQTTGGNNSTKKIGSDEVDSSIQEHIQNKTYFVKISHASNSNALSVLVILTLLLVIAGIFYIADQRGIITLPL